MLPGSRVDHGRVPALEAKTGRRVQVAVVPLCPPRADEEEGDPFVASVLKNHVLAYRDPPMRRQECAGRGFMP